MFQRNYGEVVTLSPPGEEDRRSFFTDLLLVQAARPPPHTRTRGAKHTYTHIHTHAVHTVCNNTHTDSHTHRG